MKLITIIISLVQNVKSLSDFETYYTYIFNSQFVRDKRNKFHNQSRSSIMVSMSFFVSEDSYKNLMIFLSNNPPPNGSIDLSFYCGERVVLLNNK